MTFNKKKTKQQTQKLIKFCHPDSPDESRRKVCWLDNSRQFLSSEPSPQSLLPSHFQRIGTQRWLSQRKSPKGSQVTASVGGRSQKAVLICIFLESQKTSHVLLIQTHRSLARRCCRGSRRCRHSAPTEGCSGSLSCKRTPCPRHTCIPDPLEETEGEAHGRKKRETQKNDTLSGSM